MPAPISEARREAFFRALAETGNPGLAAARVRLSPGFYKGNRKRDPAFRAKCEALMAKAGARLEHAQGPTPAIPGWHYAPDGVELTVRSGGRGRQAHLMRARTHQWSPRAEQMFLNTLAASCNVLAACRAAGLTPSAAYQYRKRSKAFSDRWRQALEIGTTRLEFALLQHAADSLSGAPIDADIPMPRMTVFEAISFIKKQRNALEYRLPRGKPYRTPPDVAAGLGASILRKLDTFARQRALEASDPPDWMRSQPSSRQRRKASR